MTQRVADSVPKPNRRLRLTNKATAVGVRVRMIYSLLMAFLGLISSASAQVRLVPIVPFQKAPTSVSSPTQNARIKALQLPFFDDFSTVTNRVDPALWQAGGNVYINNTMPINHPSVNVATFDGLDANGTPYDFTNVNASGGTDTLTSLPIDLSGFAARDAIFLSFYWQRKGLGELPDAEDSLRLQFLDNTGAWQTVWVQGGAAPDINFTQTFVAVDKTTFFHAAFQFRFQSFGRQSGAFDSWHVDYIYMNRGRSASDRYIKDIATRQAVTPFLKRYSAMPLKQYLVNPAAETADTVRTDIVNLFNNFNFTTFRFTVRDRLTGQTFQDYQQTLSDNIGSLSSQAKVVKPQALPSGLSNTRVVLQSKFDVLTTDDQNPSIPTINLRRNDTISGITVLDDYYAYDDGTAEIAVQNTQRQGRVALRFRLNKADVVSGVQVCFVPVRTNLSGRTAVFSVYADDRGRPGRTLYQVAAPISYASTRNGFVTIPFQYGVAVTDTFYVGWTQVSEDYFVAIGFDRNSPFGNQMFQSVSSTWDATNLGGVPMIRPIIGGLPVPPITGVDDDPTVALQVYPNPNPGVLIWTYPSIQQIEVLDLAGRLQLSVQPTPDQRQLAIGHLTNGFYLVRLSDGKRTVVQKIIVQK